HALKMKMEGTSDLLNFAGSIALVGLALFLMHKGESHAEHSSGAEHQE
ncbi:MAG: YqhA family protein, partial [Nitrosomonadales bacterium]